MTSVRQKKEALLNHFEVSLSELGKGPVVLDRDIPLTGLAEKLKYCEYEATAEGGHINVEIEPLGGGVLVRGGIEANVHTKCGICLADAHLKLTPVISAYLLPKPAVAKNEDYGELTPEDLEKEWFDGDKIILDGLLFDSIMLEMPMNPKCSDSCPGFPKVESSRQDKQIDPRLAPLASLKVEKEK